MFSRASPQIAQYGGHCLFHTSAVVAARPKYGVGKGMKFIPARARLADKPGLNTSRRSNAPAKPQNRTPPKPNQSHAPSRPDSAPDQTSLKKHRAPKRERVMDVPSELREIPAHLSTSPTSGFTSPPLLPGLVEQIRLLLGFKAKPTPVQSLSLAHFFRNHDITPSPNGTLLAAETGSGKSLAYLLPVIQSLKKSELISSNPNYDSLMSLLKTPSDDPKANPLDAEPEPSPAPLDSTTTGSTDPEHSTFTLESIQPLSKPAPRALILVPTHELARQIKSALSYLTHPIDTKLRSVCLSQNSGRISNTVSYRKGGPFSTTQEITSAENLQTESRWQGIDIVVATPAMLLDFTRPEGRHGVGPRRPGDDPVKKQSDKEVRMNLDKVEWIVVDEADVLFDPDFSSWTEAVLQDVKSAATSSPNRILATATISSRLSTYLSTHYPSLTYLTTPNLHKLPASLQTEYVHWDRRPGNRLPTILRKMQDLWAEEERDHPGWKEKSKIVVFCNQSSKVEELGAFLEEKGVKCVRLTSTSEARARGSNRHIQSFLKPLPRIMKLQPTADETSPPSQPNEDDPRVLITTSLLSRGLDFSPLVTSVFIVDEPRNEVDYIHRAGRAGRAGRPGRVIVFAKGQGGVDRAMKGTRRVWGFDAA